MFFSLPRSDDRHLSGPGTLWLPAWRHAAGSCAPAPINRADRRCHRWQNLTMPFFPPRLIFRLLPESPLVLPAHHSCLPDVREAANISPPSLRCPTVFRIVQPDPITPLRKSNLIKHHTTNPSRQKAAVKTGNQHAFQDDFHGRLAPRLRRFNGGLIDKHLGGAVVRRGVPGASCAISRAGRSDLWRWRLIGTRSGKSPCHPPAIERRITSSAFWWPASCLALVCASCFGQGFPGFPPELSPVLPDFITDVFRF
ncbi:Uncharacterised protein [Klebsiella pneumoniae]|nr:Uncharacterised protein [Klebsiella pneumoniae]